MDSGSLFPAGEQRELKRSGVYLRIAVERGIDALDGPQGLTYCAIADEPVPALGERVMVPLGRGDRSAPGIVIEVGGSQLAGNIPVARIKPILSSTGTVLPPSLLELGRWMSDYYMSPLGMVYASILPAAVKQRIGERSVTLYAPNLAATSGQADTAPPLKPAAAKLWKSIIAMASSEFPLPARTLLERSGVKGVKAVQQLVDAGLLIAAHSTDVHAREIQSETVFASAERPALTPAQSIAVEAASQSLGGFHVHLIRGVTGSGKTEVYLNILERGLRLGLSAIVLVPEIALTPQTAGRFTSRFGATDVAVLHSGLTSAQRNKEWARAVSGRARVVVGARSAVFAPLERLGLIIVDEEHDSSYKQDRLPRYQARDVAIKRAHLENATVVLGSATPSLESWGNATATPPRYSLITLSERVGGASMPQVHIVDMREERRIRARNQDGSLQHLIGPTLEHAIAAALKAQSQVLLLLNRRGFASYVSCTSAACGFVLACDQCDANLVLHRHEGLPAGGLVQCHHCESQQLIPKLCPACGKKLNLFAGGTQRLEDEISRKFGAQGLIEGQTFARIDSDTMQSAGTYFDTLGRFAKGELRLLLGTQMISKGLDFPGVRLVGVIDADTSLSIPDFRAAERTFQLISQVSGRAGRGSLSGHVLVQTNNPTNSAILLAQRHDFVTFADRELKIRQTARLPPFSRMARIVTRDLSEAKALAAGEALVASLKSVAPASVSLRGPLPCPVSRIANYFRFGIDVVAPDARVMHQLLHTLRTSSLLKSDAATAIDIDPVALM